MSEGPSPEQGTGGEHGSRPRPWPAPGGDAEWAEEPARQAQVPPQPAQRTAPVAAGEDSSVRRVLSALALVIGGLLIVLGVVVLAASAHQQGSGGAAAGVFTFILAAPFLMVGARGWRRPRQHDLPASPAPPETRTAPKASDEPYERPLPFPPRSPAPTEDRTSPKP